MEELDELIQRRTEKVRLMQADGDNSHETLAKLYGNPTHFITELLQNAEDEGANTVEFKLTENELVFSHDSKNLFVFNDIRAISNFGDNHEKKEKPNAIGRFGIGFKSVYSITDRPRIISADYDITILDYNIPQRTENAKPNYFNGTKIILPFKSDIKEKIYELLQKELQDLNLHYLLFLSNIRLIKTPFGIYERESQKKDKRFISLKTATKEKKYFLLEKQLEIDNKKLAIKIAFQLGEQERKVVIPCDKSPLFVFFPTKIETNLKFLVHAPFYTTPARENIQENDNLVNIEADHRNEELKKELGKLLAASLSTFKNMKLLTVEMLNVLPIDKDNCNRSPIYKELYDAVINEFSSNKELIPNATGGFSAAKDLMLLGSADLAELLTKKQTQKLFGKSFWVNKKITNDKTKKLRDYIYYDLDVPEYDLTGFVSKIDAEFMLEQSDNWVIQFYSVVHKANALWRASPKAANNGILRSKPIIRTESKEKIKQVVPFQSNGKPNVFLPTKEHSKYATVKQNIAKNKEARKFLEDIGLTTPDLFAELNEFVIPKFRSAEIYPGYFEDFKKVLEAVQSTNQEKRNRLIHDLRESSSILGFNFETGETKLLKCNEVYFLTDNLKTYFSGNSSAFFVATEQYSLQPKEESKFQSLLKEIGVNEYPNRIEFQAELTWQERSQLRNGNTYSIEYYYNDYRLDGLTEFLNQEITLEKSVALWNLLGICISSQPYSAQKFFQGEYAYKYYSDYYIKFDSAFLKQLKESSWLVVESSKVLTKEISFSNLPDIYKANNQDSRTLSDILGFKADEIRAIEERTGGKFLPADEYEKFKKWKSEQETEPENKTDNVIANEFTPDCKPEEATLNSRELEDTKISIPFQSGQGNNPKKPDDTDEDETPTNTDTLEEKPTEKLNPRFLKDIGDWGQDYVFRDLSNEFGTDTTFEVVDLNKGGQTGVGADFKVTKDGEIFRVIEVKSTVEPFGQTLSISGTQWEVARNYFNENDGDKYWVYCVFNAGQENAEIVKIKNPLDKWTKGKLFAHPINFIIN